MLANVYKCVADGVIDMKNPRKQSKAKNSKAGRRKNIGALSVVAADLGSDDPPPLAQLPAIQQQTSQQGPSKPLLIVRDDDLTWTALQVGKLFAESGFIFDRAGPV